ncbi:MAG: hypothetical protein ACYC7E_09310 [Armatimonadota bacterium]
MTYYRWCLLVCSVLACLTATLATPVRAPWDPEWTVVGVKPGDTPAAMPAVQALLLSRTSPQLEALGLKDPRTAYTPPVGDPSTISKQDYLDYIKARVEILDREYFSGTPAPSIPPRLAHYDMPFYMAMYQATGEAEYARKFFAVARIWLAGEEAESPFAPGKPRNSYVSVYWCDQYAHASMAINRMSNAPGYQEFLPHLKRAVGDTAMKMPVYWEMGTLNRAIAPALWYDWALQLGVEKDNPEKAAQLRRYADRVWEYFYPRRDLEENDSHYGVACLNILWAWLELRGIEWTKDPKLVEMFGRAVRLTANDGMYPGYGAGAFWGEKQGLVALAETLATHTRDGQYRWYAHRLFWWFRNQHARLAQWSPIHEQRWIPFAYVMADETVKERAPQVGMSMTLLPKLERLSWSPESTDSVITGASVWYKMHPEDIPGRLIYRAGTKPGDMNIIIQAASWHGRTWDQGPGIIWWGQDGTALMSSLVGRLYGNQGDFSILNLQLPDLPEWSHQNAVARATVPVLGNAVGAAYARIHTTHWDDFPPTPERWAQHRQWAYTGGGPAYGPEKAMGYHDWPADVDRAYVIVANRFVVVRDTVRFTLDTPARIGQNFVAGAIGPAGGTHWVNTWMPTQYSYPPMKWVPLDFAPRDLLIWFSPRKDATLQLIDRSSDRKKIYPILQQCYRAWYQIQGEYTKGDTLSFTSVLIPHPADVPATQVAANINLVRDDADGTVVEVHDGARSLVIGLGLSGKALNVGGVLSDGEATIVTKEIEDKVSRVTAWHATRVSYGRRMLLITEKPANLDQVIK